MVLMSSTESGFKRTVLILTSWFLPMKKSWPVGYSSWKKPRKLWTDTSWLEEVYSILESFFLIQWLPSPVFTLAVVKLWTSAVNSSGLLSVNSYTKTKEICKMILSSLKTPALWTSPCQADAVVLLVSLIKSYHSKNGFNFEKNNCHRLKARIL